MSFLPEDLSPRGEDCLAPPDNGHVGSVPTTYVLSSRLQALLLSSAVVAWSLMQPWADLQGQRLPEHYLPWGNGFYHCQVIWCFFFTVACMPARGTPPCQACSHLCPLESGQLMETAVNPQLLLVPYPLLSLKPWLFQMTSILLTLGPLPLIAELEQIWWQLTTTALPVSVPLTGVQVPHSLQSHKSHTALFLTIFSSMPTRNVPYSVRLRRIPTIGLFPPLTERFGGLCWV